MKKNLTLDNLTPTMNSVGEEVTPFAQTHLAGYFSKDFPARDSSALATDVEADLYDAIVSWEDAEDDAPEKRAALVRIAARAMACLAIDEVRRGMGRIAREMRSLDSLGFVKVRVFVLPVWKPSTTREAFGIFKTGKRKARKARKAR